MPQNKKIERLLSRGVSEIIVREDLEKKLKSSQKLRIKLGIDPTGSHLTLGHAVVLRKLREFQDLGHTVIFLFGGYTATIGDPTGKNEARPILSVADVEKNAQNYLEQASRILDISNVEVRNNAEWFSKFRMVDLIELIAKKSASQILARRDFRERLKNDVDIYVNELLYPMLQGYDSVELDSDVEIGGNDQLFNVLVGRDLQKKYGRNEGQNVLVTKILVGTDGIEKMSKSLGNYIAILDSPAEKFGKIMSIPDTAMPEYFECLTDISADKFQNLIAENPRDAKVLLAKEIISWIDGLEHFQKAFEDFQTKFVKKEIPDEMPEFSVGESKIGILDLISKITKFAPSNSEARRLVEAGSVSIDKECIIDPYFVLQIDNEKVLKVGKRKFARIKPSANF